MNTKLAADRKLNNIPNSSIKLREDQIMRI
jgi:hypothetical protein